MKARDLLRTQLQTLRLLTAANVVETVADQAQKESWAVEAFASELLTHEVEGRRQLRVQRLAKAAHLPVGKTLAAFVRRGVRGPDRKSVALWFARPRQNALCGRHRR
jgi:DNA replication protein DnaC